MRRMTEMRYWVESSQSSDITMISILRWYAADRALPKNIRSDSVILTSVLLSTFPRYCPTEDMRSMYRPRGPAQFQTIVSVSTSHSYISWELTPWAREVFRLLRDQYWVKNTYIEHITKITTIYKKIVEPLWGSSRQGKMGAIENSCEF